MRPRFATLVVLAVLALVLPAARAQSPEFQAEHAELKRSLVQRMLGLAEWCHDQQLFLERDTTWRRVLAIDPENMDARKGLRYAHNRDGTWKEPAPRTVQNLNKQALLELPAKRGEAIHPFRDALLARLEKEPDAAKLSKGIHEELLQLDPDDDVVRARMGYVQDAGQWVLAETVRGKTRRGEIRTIVKAALESADPASPAPPTDAEKGWIETWGCGSTVAGVRVLGVGTQECEPLARTIAAAVKTVGALFGGEPRIPSEFNFYTAPGPARATLLGKLPNLTTEYRAFFEKAPGGGLPGTSSTLIFDADEKHRRDCAVRNALWHVLKLNYGIAQEHAWAFEGLGLYLTRELVGTRYTWSLLANPATDKQKAALLVPDSNWMNEALKILTAANAPDLGVVLNKTVGELGLPDMLVDYAFAAYLVEGHPDKVAELLRRTGAGAKIDATSREVLGLTVPALQDHLVQWMKERK